MEKRRKEKREGKFALLLIVLFSLLIISRIVSIYISEGIISTSYRDPLILSHYYRGTLYDRSKNIVAMDRTSYLIRIECERVSEVSRLSNYLARYINITALELENVIRQSEGAILVESNMLNSEVDGFNRMLRGEHFDHYVSLEEKRERVYPQNEHGLLITGRLGKSSAFSAEAIFDEELTAPLSLKSGIVEGKDFTLSLSLRTEYILDHIIGRYIHPESEEFLLLSVIDYSTGEIYAISNSTKDESDIDYDAISIALGGRPYTILKTERNNILPTPSGYSGISNGKYLEIHYINGFALSSLSSEAEIAQSALMELESLISF